MKKKLQKVYSDYMTSMMEKMKEDDLKVDLKGQELNFEVVEDRVVENSFQFKPNPSDVSVTSVFFYLILTGPLKRVVSQLKMACNCSYLLKY